MLEALFDLYSPLDAIGTNNWAASEPTNSLTTTNFRIPYSHHWGDTKLLVKSGDNETNRRGWRKGLKRTTAGRWTSSYSVLRKDCNPRSSSYRMRKRGARRSITFCSTRTCTVVYTRLRLNQEQIFRISRTDRSRDYNLIRDLCCSSCKYFKMFETLSRSLFWYEKRHTIASQFLND